MGRVGRMGRNGELGSWPVGIDSSTVSQSKHSEAPRTGLGYGLVETSHLNWLCVAGRCSILSRGTTIAVPSTLLYFGVVCIREFRLSISQDRQTDMLLGTITTHPWVWERWTGKADTTLSGFPQPFPETMKKVVQYSVSVLNTYAPFCTGLEACLPPRQARSTSGVRLNRIYFCSSRVQYNKYLEQRKVVLSISGGNDDG